jgi:predicted acylesterase/phospholipase RssA
MSNEAMQADTLVISGGGADGIAFIGAMDALEQSARVSMSKLRNIVGCSVGAIMAVLIAVGMRSSDMMTWVMDGVSKGLTKLDRVGIFHITTTLGIDDGTRIVEHIRSALLQRLDGNGNPSFREFVKATGINLTIVVTNVYTAKRELLSVDTEPDMPVLTAVRMSFAVPVIFTPVQWRNGLYVDGALIDCCPTAHIETSGDATHAVVLNIHVPYNNVPDKTSTPQSTSLLEYGALLCRLVTMRQQVVPCATSRGGQARPTILCTINIPSRVSELAPFNLRTMNLDVTSESIEAMVAHGRACAQAVLH